MAFEWRNASVSAKIYLVGIIAFCLAGMVTVESHCGLLQSQPLC